MNRGMDLERAAALLLDALDKFETAKDLAQLFRALRSVDEARNELRSALGKLTP